MTNEEIKKEAIDALNALKIKLDSANKSSDDFSSKLVVVDSLVKQALETLSDGSNEEQNEYEDSYYDSGCSDYDYSDDESGDEE